MSGTTTSARAELGRVLALQDERVALGRCVCGCGGRLEHRARGRRAIDERHKDRAYRERLKAAAADRGEAVRQTLHTLQATVPTGKRRTDASARRRGPQTRPRPGVTVYLKRPELLGATIDGLEAALDALQRINHQAASALEESLTAHRAAQARHEKRRKRR